MNNQQSKSKSCILYTKNSKKSTLLIEKTLNFMHYFPKSSSKKKIRPFMHKNAKFEEKIYTAFKDIEKSYDNYKF